MKAQHYKFQALITLNTQAATGSGDPDPGLALADLPPGQIRRMVVRGEHHRTHRTHFFSALVANNGEGSSWLDGNHAVVTVMLVGDELADHFGVGDHFALWRGHDVAVGVITRRLFT